MECVFDLPKSSSQHPFRASHPGKLLLSEGEWLDIAHHSGLTPRELEVLRTTFEGATREATANALGVSIRTVRQYMENLHLKLHVSDRVELVLRVVQTRDRLRALAERQGN